MAIGPNIGMSPQDGAMLIAMLDRVERRLENIEGRIDHLQEAINEAQLEHVRLESKGTSERLKMYMIMAAVGGAGGSIFPRIIEVFGLFK